MKYGPLKLKENKIILKKTLVLHSMTSFVFSFPIHNAFVWERTDAKFKNKMLGFYFKNTFRCTDKN